MLTSMTGFGRGEHTVDGVTATADVRSVNGRFLEMKLNTPRSLNTQEQAMRELVRSRTGRGPVHVHLSVTRDGNEELGVSVDVAAARTALAMLTSLKDELNMRDAITLRDIVAFPDVVKEPEREENDETAWEAARGALERALDALNAMRNTEGERLGADLLARVATLEENVSKVESLIVAQVETRRAKLRARIAAVVDEAKIDSQRMALEAALIADKLDITEECVRFRSHIAYFREQVAAKEPAGRKLNFLLQEMNREVNTMGSKAEDPDIARVVVGMKEELEKIREQVQNLE